MIPEREVDPRSIISTPNVLMISDGNVPEMLVLSILLQHNNAAGKLMRMVKHTGLLILPCRQSEAAK